MRLTAASTLNSSEGKACGTAFRPANLRRAWSIGSSRRGGIRASAMNGKAKVCAAVTSSRPASGCAWRPTKYSGCSDSGSTSRSGSLLSVLISATKKSSSRERSRGRNSSQSRTWTRTPMAGCAATKRASAVVITDSTGYGPAPMLSWPACSVRLDSTSWSRSSAICTTWRARCTSKRPMSVGTTPTTERRNNAEPICCSSNWMLRDSAGWLRCRATAARAKLPCSASASTWRICRSSKAMHRVYG